MQRSVYLHDFAKAIGGAKISLGFLRKENRDDYTQRSFEIPACGGCLLAERTARHSAMYREGVEAEFFDADSLEELVAKTKRLLTDDEYRERLRDSGLEAVRRKPDTYADRVQWLLDEYQRAVQGNSTTPSPQPARKDVIEVHRMATDPMN
jgi:spore maturation protein CgeB